MNSRWSGHLDEDAQENHDAAIRNSQVLIRRFLEILGEDDAKIIRQDRDPAEFDKPSWSQKQAYRNGQLAVIARYKELFTL